MQAESCTPKASDSKDSLCPHDPAHLKYARQVLTRGKTKPHADSGCLISITILEIGTAVPPKELKAEFPANPAIPLWAVTQKS